MFSNRKVYFLYLILTTVFFFCFIQFCLTRVFPDVGNNGWYRGTLSLQFLLALYFAVVSFLAYLRLTALCLPIKKVFILAGVSLILLGLTAGYWGQDSNIFNYIPAETLFVVVPLGILFAMYIEYVSNPAIIPTSFSWMHLVCGSIVIYVIVGIIFLITPLHREYEDDSNNIMGYSCSTNTYLNIFTLSKKTFHECQGRI
jgi:hypothetical protein